MSSESSKALFILHFIGWSAEAGSVLTGAASGIILALMLARGLKSIIYNVRSTDPLTFASVGIIVIAVAVMAC